MKNRKFIKKIIFSILLLLCVCVLFLVHKNNVKASTDITDLTGTTWTFNETIDVSNTFTYDIDFTSYNVYFNTISSDYNFPDVISLIYSTIFDITSIAVYNSSGNFNWANESYRTISVEGGTDATNVNLINYLNNNATLVSGGTPEEPEAFDLTLEEYEENVISFSFSSNFYYSINDTDVFVPLITADKNLPYTINEITSITFKNDNIKNDLVLYDQVTLPVSILTIVEPGQQYTLDITENLTLYLGQAPSDNPIPPTPGETNVVSGGYRFNTLVSSSIFGDIEEQMLDILFEENFYLYNDTSRSFDMFTLRSENIDGTGALYFCYENSLTGDYVHAGVVSSDKTYISIFTSYRTIEWETQYVSPEVYTYLIDNGNFGDYEIPPSEPSPDNPLGWLINNVNDFLQIEILPGLPIIWLIQFALIVPLCLIVLKMYFGG